MKKLRNIIALMAVFGMTAFLTGCGDDDDDNGNNNQGGGPVAPQSEAELTAQTKTYRVTLDNGEQFDLNFLPNRRFQASSGGTNAPIVGSFTEPSLSGNTWTINYQPDAGQEEDPGVITLQFSDATHGTFINVINSTPPEEDRGSFVVQATGGTDGGTDGGTNGQTDGGTNGQTDGGTNGQTDGGTDGGTAGDIPENLAGKTLSLNGEDFSFSSNTQGNTGISNNGSNELAVEYNKAGRSLVMTQSPGGRQWVVTSFGEATLTQGGQVVTGTYNGTYRDSEGSTVEGNDGTYYFRDTGVEVTGN